MENTIFSGEIKKYIAAASVYKCIPASICEELINYLCGTSKLTLNYTPYEEMHRLEIMMRHYLQDVSVRKTVLMEGYDIYWLEAVKRIYVALYNIVHSYKLMDYLDDCVPDRRVKDVARDLLDMAAEQLLNSYMADDGYILLENGDDTYFDHLKTRQPDMDYSCTPDYSDEAYKEAL